MMLGWCREHRVRQFVVLDPVFPWPSLHHGREAMRIWAKRQGQRRRQVGDEGPVRISAWPIRSAVTETGDAELIVWPCAHVQGLPRQWRPEDAVWRLVLSELAHFVAQDLKCQVRLRFMPGGEPFRKTLTVPSLQGVRGFYGWRRGESEPRASVVQRQIRDGILKGMACGGGMGVTARG